MSTTQEILRGIDSRLSSVEVELKAIPELKSKFDKYVTHERFRPVEYIVYGLAGGVMLTVLTAILSGTISVKAPEATQTKDPVAMHQAFYVPTLNEVVIRETPNGKTAK